MNKPNILITGANGQLGSEIRELSEKYIYNFFFTSKDNLDVTCTEKIKNFIEKNRIDTIINCAAYTAVDKAEEEIEISNKINHLAVENLALIAKEKKIKFIHVSTDYVFDGTSSKPYNEDGITNPQTTYGKTKLDGENKILKVDLPNSIIIRTSWVYSFYGKNFLKTIINLAKTKNKISVIYDQVGTPTYAKDLAKTILDIIPKINNNKTEIFHYSNEGVTSWFDFAKEIIYINKLNCKINPIETKDYPTLAKRPHYSLLNKNKIKTEFKIDIPYWKDSLNECLKILKYNTKLEE